MNPPIDRLAELERQRRELQEDLLNATRSTESASWNALLTFNAIIIGVFSIASVTVHSQRFPIILLVACCVVSSAVLIINFAVRREHTLKFFELFMAGNEHVDQAHIESLKQKSKKTERMFVNIRRREKLALFLLIPEVGLILFLLLTDPLHIDPSASPRMLMDTSSVSPVTSTSLVDSLEGQKTKAGTAHNTPHNDAQQK